MKKFLINFSYFCIVFFDLFGSFIINSISIILRKKNENDFILVYAPYRYKPWILNKIINDLKTNSNKKDSYKIFKYLFPLALFRFNKGGNIFLMQQSLIMKLEIAGFTIEEISTFYTHSQINQLGLKNIRKLKKIFCLNDYEYALLNTYGISSRKLVRFPVGINPNFIIKSDLQNLEKREIDVLFSLRYFVKNPHYKIRKRYEFIIKLANLLAESQINVCILGEGWEQIKASLNQNIKVLELEYDQYPHIYQNSKVYCNPSLVEGGPTSLIEAFSSGCFILTSPIGLSFNLCLDDKYSQIIPFNQDENYWKKSIIKILANDENDYIKILSSRNKKIEGSLFKNLSKKLEENLF